MPTTKFHSGQLTLKALRDECQALQEHDVSKLVHLQGAKVQNPANNQTKFNQAQYVSLNDDFTKIPTLTFIAVDDPSKIPSIIADQLKPGGGGLLIFDEILFVEDKEQRALGFGKV
jgi:hypothetical protein